jgi:predicted acylesterase/phospholipase RssA
MTHSVVLSGGGAFAAFEVGVMKAMAAGDSPVNWGGPSQPKVFSGTSAGSFNGAVLLSHGSDDLKSAIDNLEKIWRERIAGTLGPMQNGVYRLRFDPFGMLASLTSPSRMLSQLREITEDSLVIGRETILRSYRVLSSTGSLMSRVSNNLDFSVWLATERYGQLVQDVIRPKAIRESRHKLLINVTDWTTGTLRLYDNTHMTDKEAPLVVQASSAIPGVFPPVRIGEHVLVDGGVLMNTPLRPAIDAGAEVISIIELQPDVALKAIDHTTGTLSILDRIIATSSGFAIKSDIETARRVNSEIDDPGELGEMHREKHHHKVSIHRFRPKALLGTAAGMLNMAAANLNQFIQLGYEAARDHNCRESHCVIAS